MEFCAENDSPPRQRLLSKSLSPRRCGAHCSGRFGGAGGGRGRAPLCQDTVAAPFERTAIDILTFPVPTGHASDYFSKWTQAFSLPDHRAVTVANVLVTLRSFSAVRHPYVSAFGPRTRVPVGVVQTVKPTAGDKADSNNPIPQSDGMVERFNRTLLDMLSKLCAERGSDWDDHLAYALCAYRVLPMPALDAANSPHVRQGNQHATGFGVRSVFLRVLPVRWSMWSGFGRLLWRTSTEPVSVGEWQPDDRNGTTTGEPPRGSFWSGSGCCVCTPQTWFVAS